MNTTNLRYKVTKSKNGRRFVIGDIHGCFNTLEVLIEEKIEFNKEDQLFLLGDYIDRGPRNREVLDYILELIDDGNQIYPLMGNHEYFVLRDVDFCKKSKRLGEMRDLIGSKDLLNQNYRVEERYLNFFERLPFYYELDNFILVHAGLDFTEANPLKDKMSMIYARNYEVKRELIENKILIHGHTPINISEILNLIRNREKTGRINLDNGCVYKHYKLDKGQNLGKLCALDIDKMKLYTQDNID